MSKEKIKTLGEEVQHNISTNSKTILSILGDIVTLILMVIIFAVNGGMSFADMGFIILMGVKPYLVMLINITTKGEIKDLSATNQLLEQKQQFLIEKIEHEKEKKDYLQQVLHEREIAEWRVQLAAAEGRVRNAIEGTSDWNMANDILKDIVEKGDVNGWSAKALEEKKRLLEKLDGEIKLKEARLQVETELAEETESGTKDTTEETPKRDNLFPAKTGE